MAETLVLIPGLANTPRLFERQIEALSSGRQVIVADHASDESISRMASRLLSATPGRFALAGLSMGGYVAMEVIRQAPERVTRAAFLDTSARPDTEEARADRQRLIRLAENGRLEDIVQAAWPKQVHPERRTDKELKAIVSGMMHETGAEAYIRQQNAIMARPDSRPLLASLEIPTLVVVGDRDAITPVPVAQEMADLVEWSSLVIVPESGHLSALEQPQIVTEALALWLEN